VDGLIAPAFKERTQQFSNSLLVFHDDGFDLPLLARNHAAQGVAVRVEHTAEESGGMELQEVFNVPVKTLGAIVGNEEKPGNPVAGGETPAFPKMGNPSSFLFQPIGDCLQSTPNVTVSVGPLEHLFQTIAHGDHGDGKIAAGPELNGADHQDLTDGSGGAVSF
jgi:hypothetical protein